MMTIGIYGTPTSENSNSSRIFRVVHAVLVRWCQKPGILPAWCLRHRAQGDEHFNHPYDLVYDCKHNDGRTTMITEECCTRYEIFTITRARYHETMRQTGANMHARDMRSKVRLNTIKLGSYVHMKPIRNSRIIKITATYIGFQRHQSERYSAKHGRTSPPILIRTPRNFAPCIINIYKVCSITLS